MKKGSTDDRAFLFFSIRENTELKDQLVNERTRRHDLVNEVQGCRDRALLILSRSVTVDNDGHK